MARRLTVTTDAGLCNRLRILLSGKAIAEATTREFEMLWKPSVSCGCTFERLFKNDWNVRADGFFNERRAFDLSTTPWESFPDWFALPEPALYVRHYGWLIQPARDVRHVELDRRCQKWMRDLEPVAPLARRVQEFKTNCFRANMIGVHLRRGDMALLHPDTTGNLAPTMRQVDAWLENATDAGILLCTDDGALNPYSRRATPKEDIAAHFVRRYGARVVFTRPSSLDRRSPEAIEDALVDLWLVRAADFFVGTLGSSFSELAGYGRPVPTVRTAASTPRYQQQEKWLRRIGIYDWLARKGRYEFGKDVPYTQLRARYLRRLRHFLKRGG